MWEWQNLLSELFLEVCSMKSIDMKSMGAINGWVDMGGLELPTHKPLQPCDFPKTAFTSKCILNHNPLPIHIYPFQPSFLFDLPAHSTTLLYVRLIDTEHGYVWTHNERRTGLQRCH
jgi:hypothetical protein